MVIVCIALDSDTTSLLVVFVRRCIRGRGIVGLVFFVSPSLPFFLSFSLLFHFSPLLLHRVLISRHIDFFVRKLSWLPPAVNRPLLVNGVHAAQSAAASRFSNAMAFFAASSCAFRGASACVTAHWG